MALKADQTRIPTNQKATLFFHLLRNRFDANPLPRLSATPEERLWLRSRKIDGLQFSAPGGGDEIHGLYEQLWECQRIARDELLVAFDEAGIDALVVKGGHAFDAWLDSCPLGILADVDILVAENTIQETKAILYAHGYRQQYYDANARVMVDLDRKFVGHTESTHYELAPFSKLISFPYRKPEMRFDELTEPVHFVGNTAYVEVEFDIHAQLATDLPPQPFLERAIRCNHRPGKTLSDTDHLWFLVSRNYNEIGMHGKKSLRDLVYAAGALKRGHINWKLLLEAAATYELHPFLYYHFTYLNFVLPHSIPKDVLDFLRPTNCRRKRDWGWLLPPLFDEVEDLPRVLIPAGVSLK